MFIVRSHYSTTMLLLIHLPTKVDMFHASEKRTHRSDRFVSFNTVPLTGNVEFSNLMNMFFFFSPPPQNGSVGHSLVTIDHKTLQGRVVSSLEQFRS